MVRPLRSAPITGDSSLLRTGPPAHATSVLNASQSLLLDALPLATTVTVAPRAFSRSMRKPQIKFTSPPCRTPPGQSTGTRQTPPETKKTPRFRCHLYSITTRRQRFTFVRPLDPHLTPHTAPFPHRSPRRSSANAACGGLEPPPEGRLRRACLHLSHSTDSRRLTYLIKTSVRRSWRTPRRSCVMSV